MAALDLKRFIMVAGLVLVAPVVARAQAESPAFIHGLELEDAGKFAEAAAAYQQALAVPQDRVNALLGMERTYAHLDRTEALVPIVDSLVRLYPSVATLRAVQLRAYSMLGRQADAQRAFADWVESTPGQSEPYHTYVGVLLQAGRAAAADSVIRLAGARLGDTTSFRVELAQSEAALGRWRAAAAAWRDVLTASPGSDQATAYALAAAPEVARDSIRTVLLREPAAVGARRALAALEMVWGSPARAWAALRDLPADSSSAAAWLTLATRAEATQEWGVAYDALMSVWKWHADPNVALRAASAALNAGDPAAALAVLPATMGDSAQTALLVVPIRVKALAQLGKPADARQVLEQYRYLLMPASLVELDEAVAFGWLRQGQLAPARRALEAAGPDADSSAAAGWLALYEGNLAGARLLLVRATDETPQLAETLGILARVSADSATDVGAAFLLLAQLDSANAAQAFAVLAPKYSAAGSAMLALAGRIHAAQHQDSLAADEWARILDAYPKSPEAAGAELAWARQLQRDGQGASAVQHLEHLILTYPESALVPQARRELDLARRARP